MNLQTLIGKIFQEKYLYELLLFDIEENRREYFSRFINIYFAKIEDEKIQIIEISKFKNNQEMYNAKLQYIGKKDWIEICEHFGHIDLTIYRQDRSGRHAFVYDTYTHTQEFNKKILYEEMPNIKTISAAEIEKAFQELAGFFSNCEQLQKLSSKKSI